MAAAPEILTFRFKDAGDIPNHRALPVVIYKRATAMNAALRDAEAIARWFETEWPKHGWRAAWRWGVYDFPHYHSTAHEALGVYRGHATLRLGHSTGVTVVAEAGDLIVLPAGTGHQNLGASADFHVVGGYPKGQTADLLRGESGERPGADERIARVSLPSGDPLQGPNGPLMQQWKTTASKS
jgi:uncharacterized protein YjlB